MSHKICNYPLKMATTFSYIGKYIYQPSPGYQFFQLLLSSTCILKEEVQTLYSLLCWSQTRDPPASAQINRGQTKALTIALCSLVSVSTESQVPIVLFLHLSFNTPPPPLDPVLPQAPPLCHCSWQQLEMTDSFCHH